MATRMMLSLRAHGPVAWPWALTLLASAMAFASVPLLLIDWATFKPGRIEPIWATALVDVIGPIFAVLILSVLTGFILSRRPANALGWAFAAIALLVASTMLSQEYAVIEANGRKRRLLAVDPVNARKMVEQGCDFGATEWEV